MYSLVLMAALTAGNNAPACFFKFGGGCGCCGSYSACDWCGYDWGCCGCWGGGGLCCGFCGSFWGAFCGALPAARAPKRSL